MVRQTSAALSPVSRHARLSTPLGATRNPRARHSRPELLGLMLPMRTHHMRMHQPAIGVTFDEYCFLEGVPCAFCTCTTRSASKGGAS